MVKASPKPKSKAEPTSVFITCPFCEKEQLEIIPECLFDKEGLVVTACPSCDNSWLTIPNTEIKDITALGQLIGNEK
jgi:transcription elongation factor Elf1